VVALAVLAQVTNLFEGKTHGDTASSVIHRYSSENWMKSSSFMFFYVRNIGTFHWVLVIAVNPYKGQMGCLETAHQATTTMFLPLIYSI
jgi:hypothetical protein